MSSVAGIKGTLQAHLSDPLFRNAYALLVNTLGTSAFGLAYWVLAARYYSPKVVGASSALIAALLLLSTVAQLNLGSALTRFLPRAGPAGRRLVAATYAISASLALIVSLASAPWIGKLARGADLGFGPAQLWLAVSVVVWALFALQDHVLTGLRRAIWIPGENAIYGLLKILLLMVLASAAPRAGIFASWVAPMAFLVLPVNLLIFGRLLPRRDSSVASGELLRPRQIGHFVAFDYLASLFNLASTHLLPVLIAARIGAEANAYFYIAWVIVATLDFALVSATSPLTVEGAHAEEKLSGLTAALGKRLLAGGLLVLGAILAGAPYLLSIFGREYAAQGSTLLRLLALGLLPRGLIILWMAAARVRREVKPILVAQGLVSLIVLSLSALLIGPLGTLGAGIAYVTGQGLVGLGVLPRLRRLISDGNSPPAQAASVENEVVPGALPGLLPSGGAAAPRAPANDGRPVPDLRAASHATPADVSVVVPARNAQDWLEECLKSVASCNPAEMIVVDGLSSDSTVDIARRLGAKVLSDGGRGLPVARSIGAAAASCEYVALVDSDVVLQPDSLQRLLDEFLEGRYAGLQAGLNSVSAGGGYWGRALANHHRRGWSRLWFGLAATMFRRSELLQHGFDEDFLTGEDIELRWRLKEMGQPIAVSRQTVVKHRFKDSFAFAKHQWESDGHGFARVMRKRGRDAWWLPALPLASALWGISVALVRFRPVWIPYYFCFVFYNYRAMVKQLVGSKERRRFQSPAMSAEPMSAEPHTLAENRLSSLTAPAPSRLTRTPGRSA